MRTQTLRVSALTSDGMGTALKINLPPQYLLMPTAEGTHQEVARKLAATLHDIQQGHVSMTDESQFEVGRNLASTPGKVVFENDLMQLIQYTPSTEQVYRQPLMIVPPWINKFYILDLQPKNSFIKFCVDQGHTVFVISWVNAGSELADKGIADYIIDGPVAALDAIEQATGEREADLFGFCMGGTLVGILLAACRRAGRSATRLPLCHCAASTRSAAAASTTYVGETVRSTNTGTSSPARILASTASRSR